MNSETFGMFGPRGLLAKIGTEENPHIPVHKFLVQQSPANNCVNGVNNFRLTPQAKLPTPIILLRDLPPTNAAFSVEKIHRKILSFLEPSDLLKCRLVSSSWLRMATNDKLLERNKDAIWIRHQLHTKYPPIVRVKRSWGRQMKLKDVTDFLDSLGSHPLLYSAHIDLEMTIAPHDFFTFFDHYGFVVKSLKISLEANENGKDFVYQMESLLEFFAKLLTEQMPNLESLFLEFQRNVKFIGGIDPELLLSFKNDLHFASKQNRSLRSITIGHQTPYEIINALCFLAPKLERLQVYDLNFWVENDHHLKLLMELQLEHSSFDCYRRELWQDKAALVAKVLERSCQFLEVLNLVAVYFLPGTVFPRMPNVKMLTFSTSWNVHRDFSLLPQGTSIATTFPNLKTIKIHEKRAPRCGQDRRTPKEAASFVKYILSLCKDEEVKSVRRIITKNCQVDGEMFQKHFPNAVLTDNE